MSRNTKHEAQALKPQTKNALKKIKCTLRRLKRSGGGRGTKTIKRQHPTRILYKLKLGRSKLN